MGSEEEGGSGLDSSVPAQQVELAGGGETATAEVHVSPSGNREIAVRLNFYDNITTYM